MSEKFEIKESDLSPSYLRCKASFSRDFENDEFFILKVKKPGEGEYEYNFFLNRVEQMRLLLLAEKCNNSSLLKEGEEKLIFTGHNVFYGVSMDLLYKSLGGRGWHSFHIVIPEEKRSEFREFIERGLAVP